ncbi:MAG: hypothetical protein NKF70_11385 [Methanobacterium sp. ERen5]|nr:MAG: hypothetical protein NKF70_11385 [Methanobacterium sp. ERen5]
MDPIIGSKYQPFFLRVFFYRIFTIKYPVGSIYLSITNTNPSTLFVGTWEQLKNKFLLAAADGTTGAHGRDSGGEKDHTLSIAKIHIHKHDVDVSTKAVVNTANTSPGTSTDGEHKHYAKITPAGGSSSLSKIYYGLLLTVLWMIILSQVEHTTIQ